MAIVAAEGEAVGVVDVAEDSGRRRVRGEPLDAVVDGHAVGQVVADRDPASVTTHGDAVGYLQSARRDHLGAQDTAPVAQVDEVARDAVDVVVADQDLEQIGRHPRRHH